MSDLEFWLFSIGMCGTFFSMVLYVIFGQLTVRRLRKKDELKDQLGVEFASGWDIINVAQAMALPKGWSEKLEESPISYLNANASLLRQYTTPLDKIIGALLFWVLSLSGFLWVCIVICNWLGILF